MNDFDLKAKDWDKNNLNLERAKAISIFMQERLKIRPAMKAMEFGAGTALLSFQFRDLFETITLVDSSAEMIRMCDQKIDETQSIHMNTVLIDLEKADLHRKFDIIYSQMAFHHLVDIEKVLKKLYKMVNNNGLIAIADLFTEDGSFHGAGFTGYNGFDPEWLASLLKESGFVNVSWEQCYIQKKLEDEGTIREYPVFMLIAEVVDSSMTVE